MYSRSNTGGTLAHYGGHHWNVTTCTCTCICTHVHVSVPNRGVLRLRVTNKWAGP